MDLNVILSVWSLIFTAFVVGASLMLRFRIRGFFSKFFRQRDSEGQLVKETLLARTGTSNLSADVGLIAGLGQGAQVRQTLNTIILRPTIGLRLISLGISAAMLYLIWMRPGEFMPATGVLPHGLTAVLIYAGLHTNFYEASYDDHILTAPNWFFQRHQYRWKHLDSIRDNGHYYYILHFADGRKLQLQKYLVGIKDFLTYARLQIEENNRI